MYSSELEQRAQSVSNMLSAAGETRPWSTTSSQWPLDLTQGWDRWAEREVKRWEPEKGSVAVHRWLQPTQIKENHYFFPHLWEKKKMGVGHIVHLHVDSSPLHIKGEEKKIRFHSLLKCVFPLFDSQRLNLAGPKQSTSSLLDCFFQINIFPKDLNPKQQPRLKSNTAQFLQVLGTVQSELVYSIAKMFILTLCLYMASTHINVVLAWKYLQSLLRRYCFGESGWWKQL